MINDGHWIYFFGDEESPAQTTTFAEERANIFEAARPGQRTYFTLRPLSSSNPISALYDTGDMNVKGDGFRLYVRIIRS